MNKEMKVSQLTKAEKAMLVIPYPHVLDEVENVMVQYNKKGEALRVWVRSYKDAKEQLDEQLKELDLKESKQADIEGVSKETIVKRSVRNHRQSLKRLGANI